MFNVSHDVLRKEFFLTMLTIKHTIHMQLFQAKEIKMFFAYYKYDIILRVEY